MAVFGVIAEYNPFHNGHEYQLKSIKESGGHAVVVVMSPNVVQRGDFSVFDKWIRTRAALLSGADLVLEIPSLFALATAERFALGAVSTLDALGCVEYLCFGSESGDIEKIKTAARLADDADIEADMRKYLSEGMTFAKARNLAVAGRDANAAESLNSPNDILGVEYLRCLSRIGSNIKPFALLRKGSMHLSHEPTGSFASASYIRENLSVQGLQLYTPALAAELFKAAFLEGNRSMGIHSLETALLLKLRTMTAAEIAELPDVSEGLENRIYRVARECSDFESLCFKIKTKRYTMARIRRILMYALLDFSKDKMPDSPPYIRVLGHNQKGLEILSRKTARLPVITSLAKAKILCDEAMFFADTEEKCSNVFSLTLENKSGGKNEFSTPTIRI